MTQLNIERNYVNTQFIDHTWFKVSGTIDPGQKGFQVQPRRWVVERTFAWLSNYRRLSKDFEQWMQTSDAAIYAAMSHLMVRRLARLRAAK